MPVEYFYNVFMFAREQDNVIRLTIAYDDTLMYFLLFEHVDECSNYLRILHNFAIEMKATDLEAEEQSQLLKNFIHKNPLEYEYELIGTS